MTESLFRFSLYLLCCFSNNSFGQYLTDKVDSFVQKVMEERHIPGLSLAVIQDGIPVKVKGYGFANIENKIMVNPETIFQSGSIGKQFTAAAIMQLKEEGKLQLDDKLSKYFSSAPSTWQNITIRNLLTHTSGIPDFPEDSTVINLQHNYEEKDLLSMAMKFPLDFKPGEKWAYSNTGYVLLGILIRQVTGKFYGEIMKEKIFLPLSMETARIIDERDIIINRSSGYNLKNGEWVNQMWVSPTLNTTADGSLYLTILDLIKWDAALTKEKILNHEDLQAMVTPVKLNNNTFHPYGFGWFLAPENGHKAFQHSGSWQGFNTYIARFVDDKLTIIVLTNLNPSNPGLITKDIAALYIPELGRPKVSVTKGDNTSLTGLIRILFQNPSTTDLNNQLFSKEAIQKIKSVIVSNNSLLKTFGKVQSVVPLENMGNSNQSKYLVTYKVSSRVVLVSKNDAGQIINVTSEAH